jgi:6-hydroxycyclohex-1-ene-1-carbonyl-CoA dehydrogenase
MELRDREDVPRAGEVVVAVRGCGVCHTDLGFFYDGIPTRHPMPLTLGHEVAGRVLETGPGAEEWIGRDVVVPAVIPCGACDACRAGHGSVCPSQIFPGNDVHGGFGTHLTVPARGLCAVPDLRDPRRNAAGLALADLAVVADAISTPYQAIVRSGLRAGDLAVFVGAGGVGGFGVQIAASIGAHVVAIDPDAERLALVARHGATLALPAGEMSFQDLRAAVRGLAKERDVPGWRHKIFETSGTPAGQATAWGLLGPGAYLSIVGFTPAKVEVKLSNLMAFDAVAQGNWGCLPEHYPNVLDLCLSGAVAVRPFVELRPLATINETFADLHERRASRRVILVPES